MMMTNVAPNTQKKLQGFLVFHIQNTKVNILVIGKKNIAKRNNSKLLASLFYFYHF